MDNFFEVEISEKRVLTAFLEDKVITLEAFADDDMFSGELVLGVEGVYKDSGIDCFWDNSEWITNDLVDQLFNGAEYPSVEEAYKEAQFTKDDILALKQLFIEADKRGFFTNLSINIKN